MARWISTASSTSCTARRRSSFTARRDALARQARADGDKDLAATVHALRRPTAAAWVVNCLARQAPDAVEALVALGDADAGGAERPVRARRCAP